MLQPILIALATGIVIGVGFTLAIVIAGRSSRPRLQSRHLLANRRHHHSRSILR